MEACSERPLLSRHPQTSGTAEASVFDAVGVLVLVDLVKTVFVSSLALLVDSESVISCITRGHQDWVGHQGIISIPVAFSSWIF